MRLTALRRGCLLTVIGTGLSAFAQNEQPVLVQSQVFDIAYRVNEAALPLNSVHLWYTLDKGQTWHDYGLDDDCQTPFVFHAPAEGLLGFYLRVTNRAGASSPPPGRSTQPQQWAFVDYTPPVIQLHALRQTTMLGRPVVQIRWTAIDANLTRRPVEVEYRQLPAAGWHPLSMNALANTGRYDWRVPENLWGPLAVRIHVSDEGGHRIASQAQSIELRPPAAARPLPVSSGGSFDGFPTQATPAANAASTTHARTRARQLLDEGLALRERGDYRRAIARLREAVKLDPQMTDAFAEMGEMLYLLGDLDRALAAYVIALNQRPTMRAALQGAARVYSQKQDYGAAAQRLRTILRYNPNDAEVWMNLGDIGVFQGDEVLARECYLRASQIDPQAIEVISKARHRLALMTEVSRTYREGAR